MITVTEVTGVYGIKGKAFLLPVVNNAGEIITEITDGETGKTAGMGGKNSRGENACFMAAGRENRQGNGHGALTYAGNILYGENTLIIHKTASLYKNRINK